MSPETKNCYNQLISEYINTENKQTFLELLANLEDRELSFAGKAFWGKESEELDKRLSYDNNIKIEALKLLVKIFDIKPKEIKAISGWSWTVNSKPNKQLSGTKTI